MRGNVKTGVFKSSSSVKVEEGIAARSIKAAGSHQSGSSVKAEDITIAGSYRVEGDVEAERFEIDGTFRVSGLINADKIEIELDGSGSSAREIGGSEVEVRSHSSFFRLFGGRRHSRLEVDSIEGDDIFLEATSAKVVRGKRVRIGDGCKIDTVEYTESLEVSPDATVSNQARTGDGRSSETD